LEGKLPIDLGRLPRGAPGADPADAVEGLRIIEVARRSAAERTVIELA
jgi:hypothetical protein